MSVSILGASSCMSMCRCYNRHLFSQIVFIQRFFRLCIRQKRILTSISKQNQNSGYFTQLHIEYNTSKGAKGENTNIYECINCFKVSAIFQYTESIMSKVLCQLRRIPLDRYSVCNILPQRKTFTSAAINVKELV